MAIRPKRYLYLYESLQITETEANIGTGKTLRARICATASGDPAAIGSSSGSATASGGVYTITLSRSTLQTDLGGMVGKTVWLHLDDGAAGHDVHEMVITATDPDMMPDLR